MTKVSDPGGLLYNHYIVLLVVVSSIQELIITLKLPPATSNIIPNIGSYLILNASNDEDISDRLY